MGRTAKIGLFLLMGLVVALARLVEVELGKERAAAGESRPPAMLMLSGPGGARTPKPAAPHSPHRIRHESAAKPVARAQAAVSGSAAASALTAAPAKKSTSSPTAESHAVEWPKGPVYTVRRGETPGEIARKLLGSAKLWPKLYAANRARLSSPNSVRAGTRLIVPPREGAQPAGMREDE